MTKVQELAKLVIHSQNMEALINSKTEALLDKLSDELAIEASESGADRELDYDIDDHLERTIEEAYKLINKVK